MEANNTKNDGSSSSLHDAAQQDLELLGEYWTDDEIFIPTLCSYGEKGSDVQAKSSDNHARRVDKSKKVDDRAPHNTHMEHHNHMGGDKSSGSRDSHDAEKSANVPETKNRVLSIKGLSPKVTYHTLLEKVRDVGKVFSINMIKSSIRGIHSTSLGVVMWDWTATRRLAMQAEDGLFDRDRFRPTVELSSGWFEMPTEGISNRSRVLVVRGNSSVVYQEYIMSLLLETIKVDLDEIIVTKVDSDLTVMEIRFAGYRGQAELAYERLTTDPRITGWATTEFGPDPCDRV